MRRDRIRELDFLRSLAVLLLLIHHSGIYQFQISSFPLITLSKYINHLLLGSFVFISGFLLPIMLYRREITDLFAFYRSRFIRLYIPYLAALLLFIFILNIQVSSRELVIHFFGLQILLSPKYSDPILTLWFISLLVILLSVTPIMIISFKKIVHLFTAYLFIFAVLVLVHNSFELIDIRLIYFFPIFATGSLIGVAKGLPTMKTSNGLLGGSCIGILFEVCMLSRSSLTYVPDLDLSHILWSTLYILSSIILLFRVAPLLLRFWMIQRLFLFIATSSFLPTYTTDHCGES